MSTDNIHESHFRSIAKAMSWRVTSTITTILIAYFITSEIKLALSIGGIEFILKFFTYYLHERIWLKVPIK